MPPSRLERTLTGHTGQVLGVAFSPDGWLLATASSDGTARVWDMATGGCLRTLAGHTEWVYGVAFSPDGRLLAAAAGDDKTARVFDLATGECLRAFIGHSKWVYGVAFSPDGQRLPPLLAGANTGPCKYWPVQIRLETRRCLLGITGGTGRRA